MKRVGSLLVLLGMAVSCKTVNPRGQQSEVLGEAGEPKVCAGVRGNGNLIMAHYGALSHYHEDYPPLDGIAGGSSGSITTFIYESMRMNPLLSQCGDRSCTPEETRLRLSFLLKSMLGYAEAFKNGDDVQAVMNLSGVLTKLKEIFARKDFGALLKANPGQIAGDIVKVLSSPDLNGLINPALIDPFRNLKNLEFHILELKENVNKFGSWEAADPRIFLFPGFFNWENFAKSVGRIGDFYAGYQSYYPKKEMDALLTACSLPMRGQIWEKDVILPNGLNCQKSALKLMEDYRRNSLSRQGGAHRIDDPIGKGMLAIASTSVLTGPSVEVYKKAKRDYEWGNSFDFALKFEDIRAGYFGQDAILSQVAANPRGYTDLRTRKFLSLGAQPWRVVLSTSPAEPSLSEIRPLPGLRDRKEVFSVGGWVDLSPSLVLHNAGCDKVVYFTRHVPLSAGPGFAGSIIKMLGASEKDLDDLVSPDPNREPPSSFSLANQEADAVWCTDWDTTSATDMNEHFRAGYIKAHEDGPGDRVQFLTSSAYFLRGSSVANLLAPSQGRRACVTP